MQPSAGRYSAQNRRREDEAWYQRVPWWIGIIGIVIVAMAVKLIVDPDYDLAWKNIFPGVWITIRSTFYAFAIALFLGLIAGLGQVSHNFVARNVARAYVELVRGIPILPLIFTLALVIIPDVSSAVGAPNSVPNDWRAISALALIYGAYMAEIFRGGIQSVPRGQTEAGRSLGLTRRQTMRSVILPQAGRAIIPPIANDFIAILKDTSLLSVLGVLEITRRTRQFSASSFKFAEAFFTMTFIYLVLVLALSALLSGFERWMTRDRAGER
jgi:polar amino acid transport system permease protein